MESRVGGSPALKELGERPKNPKQIKIKLWRLEIWKIFVSSVMLCPAGAAVGGVGAGQRVTWNTLVSFAGLVLLLLYLRAGARRGRDYLFGSALLHPPNATSAAG